MKKQNGFTLIELLIAVAIVVILFAVIFGLAGGNSIDDDAQAMRALEANGFTNAKIVDRSYAFPSYNGCSDGDRAAIDVEADNSIGKRVRLTVCIGQWGKGATVRVK